MQLYKGHINLKIFTEQNKTRVQPVKNRRWQKRKDFPSKWLSCTSRRIFADRSSSISNYRPQQNWEKEIFSQKSLISRKLQFKVWKNIIKWKYNKKRELLFKNKESNLPFKMHSRHTTTRPPHYGSTVAVAVSIITCL